MSEPPNELPVPAICNNDKPIASTSNQNKSENIKTEDEKKSTFLSPADVKNLAPIKNEVESLNSSSATGNPRNKCALKPGHSLMDWIRLGNSGVDLTGTKGVIKPVSHAELAKHNKETDAWLAIRGKVYNVTSYMSFHPGGVDELMKGVGKDATKIFDDVHAWVNYEQLLSKCLIGPLRTTVNLSLDSKPHKIKSSTSPNRTNTILPALLNITPIKIISSTSAPSSPTKQSKRIVEDAKVEIIPRFDWIQKTHTITIIFYTQALCNPGLTIHKLSNRDIRMEILIQNTIHNCSFKFSEAVDWPCSISLSIEIGKIEVIFNKSVPALWTNIGLLDRHKTTDLSSFNYDYYIKGRKQFNHDSFALEFISQEHTIQIYPIGSHVSITTSVNGEDVTRSYTPVPSEYLETKGDKESVPFLIKSYDTGILAKYLTTTAKLFSDSNKQLMSLSHAKCNLNLNVLKNHSRIGLLSAGSGITAMLSVLDFLLTKRNDKMKFINMINFNKKEEDIWCHSQLDDIAKQHKTLRVEHILSDPSNEWVGKTGRINADITNTLGNINSDYRVTYCMICGPKPFNELSQKLLLLSGFLPENLYFFQG